MIQRNLNAKLIKDGFFWKVMEVDRITTGALILDPLDKIGEAFPNTKERRKIHNICKMSPLDPTLAGDVNHSLRLDMMDV